MMTDKWMFVSGNLQSGARTRPLGAFGRIFIFTQAIGVYTHRYICMLTYRQTCTHELPNRRIRHTIFEHALHMISECRGDEHA